MCTLEVLAAYGLVLAVSCPASDYLCASQILNRYVLTLAEVLAGSNPQERHEDERSILATAAQERMDQRCPPTP